jgi:hypothetical protein
MYITAVSYGAPFLWQTDGAVTLLWAGFQSSIASSELCQSFAASLTQRWDSCLRVSLLILLISEFDLQEAWHSFATRVRW